MPQTYPLGAIKGGNELRKSISPLFADKERLPWQWYHRRTFTDNSTTTLTFFDATGAATVTNMQAAGQIPAPMFYEVHHIQVYFDVPPTIVAIGASATVVGAVDDMTNLIDGYAVLTIAQKVYWSSPIHQLPPGAGVVGGIDSSGTYTSVDGDQFQHASFGVPDVRNRMHLWGDITIPHNQNFSLVLTWAAAVNTEAGNIEVTCILDGFLYRRIL